MATRSTSSPSVPGNCCVKVRRKPGAAEGAGCSKALFSWDDLPKR